jgi:endoglucanase
MVTSNVEVPPGPLPYGVYDPFGDFIDSNGVSIEHVFLPWEDVDIFSLFDADDYAFAAAAQGQQFSRGFAAIQCEQ